MRCFGRAVRLRPPRSAPLDSPGWQMKEGCTGHVTSPIRRGLPDGVFCSLFHILKRTLYLWGAKKCSLLLLAFMLRKGKLFSLPRILKGLLSVSGGKVWLFFTSQICSGRESNAHCKKSKNLQWQYFLAVTVYSLSFVFVVGGMRSAHAHRCYALLLRSECLPGGSIETPWEPRRPYRHLLYGVIHCLLTEQQLTMIFIHFIL